MTILTADRAPPRAATEQLGLEMEMVVADRHDGRTHAVVPYFRTLLDIKQRRGVDARPKLEFGTELAVASPYIVSSLDNAFNNLESAIGPIDGGPGGLTLLDGLLRQELEDVLDALATEDATILNFSEHPDVQIDAAFYARVRAPKPIYDYWVRDRGWNHSVGVDAKAQNGPTIAVPIDRAVDCLNVLLALAPALIALYANSPFEFGRPTGLMENRLTIWPRMFATSVFSADLHLQELPAQPFRDLGDYLVWMFGPGTAMQMIPETDNREYKSVKAAVRLDGDPSLLEFLEAATWPGVSLATGRAVHVRPSLRHLEFLQFSNFLDARIRYGLDMVPSVEEFLGALRRHRGVEDLFSRGASHCYIEGRAPGANFPDRELLQDADSDVVASCVVSAAALQAGIVRNLANAQRIVESWGWSRLRALRPAAIRNALRGQADGLKLTRLCSEVLDVAEAALDPDERWMLAYPRHVLATARTAADRALLAWGSIGGDERSRMCELLRQRAVVSPAFWGRPSRIPGPRAPASAVERDRPLPESGSLDPLPPLHMAAAGRSAMDPVGSTAAGHEIAFVS